MRLALSFLLSVCLPLAANAQPTAPPALAAPSAIERELDWNTTFETTPPFHEWIKAYDFAGENAGSMYLHSKSLGWRNYGGFEFLRVDLIGHLSDGNYHRRVLALACDDTRVMKTMAQSVIVIQPNGTIAPAPVFEHFGYEVAERGPDRWFDRLCFDPDIQAQFMH